MIPALIVGGYLGAQIAQGLFGPELWMAAVLGAIAAAVAGLFAVGILAHILQDLAKNAPSRAVRNIAWSLEVALMAGPSGLLGYAVVTDLLTQGNGTTLVRDFDPANSDHVNAVLAGVSVALICMVVAFRAYRKDWSTDTETARQVTTD